MKRRPPPMSADPEGLDAAARVLAAGGRVPRRFAARARPVSAGPTLGQAESRARVSPARLAAADILARVGAGRAHSDELLHGPRLDDLSEADRHLTTALVMGVLRWQIALDAAIRKLLERPDQALPEPVAIALRLGAFQLRHMDRIPAHAALSESVELCRAAGQPHATGMVNAILRRLASVPEPAPKIFETTAAFAERLGHPRWLTERWVRHFGRETAISICEADQAEPGSGGGLFLLEQSSPVQLDDGSRLVAELAAAAAPEGTTRVWDCCAAPGGKTMVLAARLGGAVEVLATDVSGRRLSAMRTRLRRAGVEADGPGARIRFQQVDATELAAAEAPFDLVLCDVPCSGTGTLGRNPEIRLRLEPVELLRQAERQRAILDAALVRVRPGGRMVYSTCSLEPEENEAVIAAAVGPGFRRLPVAELLPRIPGLRAEGWGPRPETPEGALRTLPGVHPCDGFFAVVLERHAD